MTSDSLHDSVHGRTQDTPPILDLTGDDSPLRGPMVSFGEAIRMVNISESSLRRRRSELRENGAVQHEDGSWSIPIAVLVDMGLVDRVTAPQELMPPAVEGVATPSGDSGEHGSVTVPLSEWNELQAQLREVRARLEERERAVKLAEMALRAIEPPKPSESESAQLVEGEEPAARTGWFRRKRR